MRPKPIVIYGAGGHGRETAQLLRDIIAVDARFVLKGFLDDDRSRHGARCGDLEILGGAEWLVASPDALVALGMGSPRAKCALVERLALAADRYPTLVHPSVLLGERVSLGPGSQLHAGCIATIDIEIEAYVTVNRRVDVSHDNRVERYATLAPSVSLTGKVRVGAGADLGARVTVIPGVSIGAWSVVGAGAVVIRDIPPHATAVGVPARVISDE